MATARLKMEEMQKLDALTISTKMGEFRNELFTIRMQKAATGIEKPHRIKEIKKDIARLMTVTRVNSGKPCKKRMSREKRGHRKQI